MIRSERTTNDLYTYLIAVNLNNWVYIDDPESKWDHPSSTFNPEETLLQRERQDKFEKLVGLSPEAKQVVRLILNGSSKILEQIKDGRGANRYSLNKLEKVIRKEFGWPWKVIWQSFQEIRTWLNNL